jgi:hypothetical protein
VSVRRWSVDLGGRMRTIELEHRTWWQRAIVRIDGSIAASKSINMAIGYDHAAAVSAYVDDHRLDVTINTDGLIRTSYRYALAVDGATVAGSDEISPAPIVSVRPTAVGITEAIIWGSTGVAVARTLVDYPLRSIALIPGALAASWILRRPDVPPSWRALGSVLVFVACLLGVVVLSGAYDPPRGF